MLGAVGSTSKLEGGCLVDPAREIARLNQTAWATVVESAQCLLLLHKSRYRCSP